MHKNSIIFLRHILECVNSILEYTNGMTEETLLNNKIAQDAVIRNFEVIGEASKKIDDGIKAKYNNVEWKKMAGMRDKLIHDYIGVDLWAVEGC
jgi:uncharacterized protein with HEPN domain